MFWGVEGDCFRGAFQNNWVGPIQTFPILETFFQRWAEGGKISQEFYYSLITMHGTTSCVITGGLEPNLCQLSLIPLQVGSRDMASPFINHAIVLVFL